MSKVFDEFFDLLMSLEGGQSNHPLDRGGKTNIGITKRTLSYYNYNYNKDYESF